MAHPEQRAWVEKAKELHPDHFKGVRVLEAGSADINGTSRYLFEDSFTIGCDLATYAGVDVVCRVHELPFVDRWFDTIICCEMLEHDWSWPASVAKMARLLKPDGLLVMTWAGPGRKEHGTYRTSKRSSLSAQGELPNYYRNLTFAEVFEQLRAAHGKWTEEHVEDTLRNDVYFMGVKSLG